MAFTVSEMIAIRHLVLHTASPDDAALSSISDRNTKYLRSMIRRHLPLLLDPSVAITDVQILFNKHRREFSPSKMFGPEGISHPPRFRARRYPGSDDSVIPTLIRRDGVRAGNNLDPELGCLAAVLHPDVGCVVGRVIARARGVFLVVFFDSSHVPLWVPPEYLYGFTSGSSFPFGDDEFYRRTTESAVTVDWLLERIFSSAQQLVTANSEILTTARGGLPFSPRPAQIHSFVMQCVLVAAPPVRVCRRMDDFSAQARSDRRDDTEICRGKVYVDAADL
jgi:hypothetical protein